MSLTLSEDLRQPAADRQEVQSAIPDPAFPTSADYAPLPEPAQTVRAVVLEAQGKLYSAWARKLRRGLNTPEEQILAELAERATAWRAVGSRPASWWHARLELHPVESDWFAEHVCFCGYPTSRLYEGFCRSCEPMECCSECGLLEPVRDLDAAGICPVCALLPLERDGEPVEAHEALAPVSEVAAAVLAGREVRRAA